MDNGIRAASRLCFAADAYYAFAALLMSETSSQTESTPAPAPAESRTVPARPAQGGAAPERPAPDPTRYGDWEKNGRCIDF